MSLDMSEKSQLLLVRISSFFEQNVLKAVSRTQIEGSCKVSEGKTNWQTNESCTLAALQARSEQHLKHPDR